MRIALFHGYELSGSGSNEYTRYLALHLGRQGHDVHVVCLEPEPEAIEFIRQAWSHGPQGARVLFERDVSEAAVTLHRIERPPILPVYVTDKERAGDVAAFVDLTDAQLQQYDEHMTAGFRSALQSAKPDVVHVNHTVWQPVVAAQVCPALGIPFFVVPHGSAIEYTVRRDRRFEDAAAKALGKASGLVFISREVRERVTSLFPGPVADLDDRSPLIGIGTDTSLFRPVTDRDQAREELDRMQRSGGRPAEHRSILAKRVARHELDDLSDLRQDWDHRVEDEDLGGHLADLQGVRDLIVFVGALTWGKGVQALIAAMPRLLARRPEAHLLVVGSGRYREALEALMVALDHGNLEAARVLIERGRSLEQPDLHGPLEDVRAYLGSDEGQLEVAAALGRLADRVHFVGRLDHPRLSKLLGWAKVAAFPSIIKEASPLVFAEALAAGVLPAASDHSGFRDGLQDLEDDLPRELWGPMHLPTESQVRVAGIADSLALLLARTDDADLPSRLAAIARRKYEWAGVAQQFAEFASTLAPATAGSSPG